MASYLPLLNNKEIPMTYKYPVVEVNGLLEVKVEQSDDDGMNEISYVT